MDNGKHTELANHAWSVADLLRGDYKQADYGKVILPFTVLRRLECVLAPTKDEVLAALDKYADRDIDVSTFLRKASGQRFYNTSKLSLKTIANDPTHAAANLNAYIGAFSDNAREVLETYDLPAHIKRLNESNLLYQVVGKFADLRAAPRTSCRPTQGASGDGARAHRDSS